MEPISVTVVLAAPEDGDIDDKTGAGTTVKVTPLLAAPLMVTMTLPDVAPDGTRTVIEDAVQFEMTVTVVPLNFTELVPCVDPKLLPLITILAPMAPEVGDRLEIDGDLA